MNLSRSCTAIDALLLTAALWAGAATAASPAATVTQANGPLFAQSAEGRIKALSTNSAVSVGDKVVTGSDTFAQLTFPDGGVVTLAPDTQLAIDAELTLIEGTIRVEKGASVNPSAVRQKLRTPAGSIDATGATFIIRYAPETAPPAAKLAAVSTLYTTGTLSDAPIVIAQLPPVPKGPTLAPGLYVQVIDGLIHLTNPAGTTNFAAGQFGFTPSFKQPPVLLPTNPGIQFTPPPMFNSPPATNTTSNSKAVDCEVR
jgi:hypothetical protein